MKKPASRKRERSGMRAEYDFSAGLRGKYTEQFHAGTNLIVLEPEVAKAFPDAKSVNDTLRNLIDIARRASKPKRAS